MSYKECRVLNKETGEIFQGKIDTELENLEEYELVEIPDDNKIYEATEIYPFYTEKTKTLEELKQELLETIDNLKKTPFSVGITDTESIEGSYYLDLQDSSILKILVLVQKAENNRAGFR